MCFSVYLLQLNNANFMDLFSLSCEGTHYRTVNIHKQIVKVVPASTVNSGKQLCCVIIPGCNEV